MEVLIYKNFARLSIIIKYSNKGEQFWYFVVPLAFPPHSVGTAGNSRARSGKIVKHKNAFLCTHRRISTPLSARNDDDDIYIIK